MKNKSFGRDTGLQTRILITFFLLGALYVVFVGVLFAAGAGGVTIAVIAGGLLLVQLFLSDKIGLAAAGAREVSPAQAPELHAMIERLCVQADLPKPKVAIVQTSMPNAFAMGRSRKAATVVATTGIMELLTPAELEAVVGHELAHVAHRDAAVMTVVGGPGAVLLQGGAKIARGWPMGIGGLVAMAVGWLGSLGGRILSRYREFAADAGAVALTGNPVALASALTKVSGGLVAIPSRDLRAVAARDAFHLLPVAPAGEYKLPATHPPLRARIERLQRMEATLQSAR